MKNKIIIAALFFLLTFPVAAQVFEKTKSETRYFPAPKGCTLNLTNKYGDIQVIPVSGDSVKFVVEVKVSNKKEADAEKKLDAISVNYTSSPFLVSATTVFRDSPGQWQAELNDLAKSVFNPTNRAEINYYVYVPSYINLKIDNKYGNIFINDTEGQVDISLSNGDLKAGIITSDASLRLSFVKASINTLKNLTADLSYSELTLKKAGNVRMNSRSSKAWITSIQKLDLESRNDKIAIDTAQSISGKTSFSGLTVSLIKDDILLSSTYGDINISEVPPSFKFINLNTEFTDVILIFHKDVFCKVFADYRKSKLNYTPGMGEFEIQVTDAEKQQNNLSGKIGTGENPSSSVQINSLSGSLTLLKR